MALTYTAEFTTEKNKKANEPVSLLKAEWPAVNGNPAKTLYLSDRAFTIGGNVYLPVVSEWGDISQLWDPGAFLDTAHADLALELINAPVDYGDGDERFSDFIGKYPLEAGTFTLYQWFNATGMDETDLAPLFVAKVEENIEWNNERIKFDLVSISKFYADQRIGSFVDLKDYPNAPEGSVGAAMPIVVGDMKKVPGIPVRKAPRTELSSVAKAGDAVLNVKATDKFPSAGVLLLNDDTLNYTGKTATQFTGVSGINQFHYAGDEVLGKVSDYRFLFSDPLFPIKDIAAVYIAGEPAAQGDWTKDIARGEIVFTNQPRGVIAYDTLFFPAEMDQAASGNTALNPTSAMDRNDFQNFATISQANPLLSLKQNDELANLGVINRVFLRIAHNADEQLNNDNATVQVRGLGSPFTLSKPASVDQASFAGNVDISHANFDNLSFAINVPNHQHVAESEADHIDEQGANSGPRDFIKIFGPADLASPKSHEFTFPAPPAGNVVRTIYEITWTARNATFSTSNPVVTCRNQSGVISRTIGFWDSSTGFFRYTQTFTVTGQTGGDIWEIRVSTGGLEFNLIECKRTIFFPPNPSTQNQALANVKAGEVSDTTGSKSVSATVSTVTQIHTQFFDITALVGGAWTWFKNKIIDVKYNGTQDGRAVYIPHVYFEIEYTRRRLAATDEITADVQGVKDDSAGTLSGTPSLLLERPDYLFKWALNRGLSIPIADMEGAQVVSLTSNTAGEGGTGWTVRNRIPASGIDPAAKNKKLRIHVSGPTTGAEGFKFDRVFIGHKAASGDPWDMAAAPVQVFFNGQAGATLALNETRKSDAVNFKWDGISDLIIAFEDGDDPATDNRPHASSAPAGFDSYHKAGVDEADLAAPPSSYSTVSNRIDLVTGIQVAESFDLAGFSFQNAISGGYKFAGLIEGGTQYRDIWGQWIKESRSRFRFSALGKPVLKYRPGNDPAEVDGLEVKTIDQNQIRAPEHREEIIFRHGATRNIYPEIQVKYSRNPGNLDFEGFISATDPVAKSLYGKKGNPLAFEFKFVRAEAMAEHLVDFYLGHHKAPALLVEVGLFLDNMELEKFDVIRFTNPLGSYNSVLAEIVSIDRSLGIGRDGKMDTLGAMIQLFPVAKLKQTGTETVTGTDSISLSALFNLDFAEGVTAADVLKLIFGLNPAADGVVVADALKRELQPLFAETVNPVETLKIEPNLLFTETVKVADSVFLANPGWGSQGWGITGWGGVDNL